LALLGVAFYTLLLPWHLTSQFAAQLYRADVGIFADAMCTSNGGDRSDPTAPKTSCPICKGLAAFQLAVATASPTALPAMPAGTPVLLALRDDVAGATVPTPRNRGPPLPA
jgi:hypothetical protein